MLHQSDLACSRSGLVPVAGPPAATSKSGERSNQSFRGRATICATPTPTHRAVPAEAFPPDQTSRLAAAATSALPLQLSQHGAVPGIDDRKRHASHRLQPHAPSHQSPACFPPGERLRQPVLTRPIPGSRGAALVPSGWRSRGPLPACGRSEHQIPCAPLFSGGDLQSVGMRGPDRRWDYKMWDDHFRGPCWEISDE